MRRMNPIYTQTSPGDEILRGAPAVSSSPGHRGSHLPGLQLFKSDLYPLLSDTLNKSFHLSEPQFL